MAEGYSGTPLPAKLGLKDGMVALKRDLIDVKVAAANEIWSGLKLVIGQDRR